MPDITDTDGRVNGAPVKRVYIGDESYNFRELLSPSESITRKHTASSTSGGTSLSRSKISGGKLFVPGLHSEFTMLPLRWKVVGPAEHDAEVTYNKSEKDGYTEITATIRIPDEAVQAEQSEFDEATRAFDANQALQQFEEEDEERRRASWDTYTDGQREKLREVARKRGKLDILPD